MSFKNKNFYKGISTIELIVSIAIFVLITTVILISYPQLSSQLALEKTTQDIASSLHETRMYGIGVKSLSDVLGNIRTKGGYGVHFERGNEKSYTLFSDADESRKYDPAPAEEKVSEFKINGSETIFDVCVLNSDDTGTGCSVDSSAPGLFCFSNDPQMKSVDILFVRPAPSVAINGFKGASNILVCPGASGSETCGRAIIVIKSPRGSCKKVEAWTTGQVTVQAN